jgi:hypothetical protein
LNATLHKHLHRGSADELVNQKPTNSPFSFTFGEF